MLFDVAFLDVGHGDCTVFTFNEPDGRQRCIVIDGGDEGSRGVRFLPPDAPLPAQRLAAYLKLRGIRSIDLLIGTHMDSDHIGGLVTFLKDFTAKTDGQGGAYWNDRVFCIGQYWGPLSDACWGLIGRQGGRDEQERYADAVKLLIKLKVKKLKSGLTGSEQAELDDLQKVIADLRGKVDDLLQTHEAREYLYRSISQNWALAELVRQHVANPEQDLLAPDLNQSPQTPFKGVQIDFLWPDTQIPDTMLASTWLRPIDLVSRRVKTWSQSQTAPVRTGRKMTLVELMEQVMDNQELLARREERKANNRSLVVRIRPSQWSGDPEAWPTVLLTGDAESESWRSMVRRYRQGELSSYVLKVPHHGSAGDNGLTPEALTAVSPRFAVISVGQTYPLPTAETLHLLRSKDPSPIDIFCTERNHNPAMQAACCVAPPGCVRKNPEDYRGVVFSFDTQRGTCSVVQIQIHKGDKGYGLRPSLIRDWETDPQAVLWCRQQKWGAE